MKYRFLRLVPLAAVAAAVAGLLLFRGQTPADPTPVKQDQLVARVVCEFLRQLHLNHPQIGDEASRKLFKRFLKDLDPNKLYFLQSDVDEWKKFETELDDQLNRGELTFPYAVYERLMARLNERMKWAEEYVAAPHDFTVKEYLDTDYDNMPFAKNAEEAKDRWRKRVKFDLLLNRVAEKPLPEAESKEKVLNRYKNLLRRWKQVDHADLLELYLTSLTTSIDPHSTYMSASTLDDFEISMRLNLDGIGALLGSEDGTTTVSEIIPGGAAAKDGRLKAKDKIIAVAQGDGKFNDIVGMKIQDVVKQIRGPRGTKVQLKVIPVGKLDPVVYELTRQKVELKGQEARGEVVEQGKKADGTPYRFGVIDLPSFYADPETGKSATSDVRRLLKEFEAKKVDGVILDLRHNGGGLLSESLSLTGLFFDKGPVVQVKDLRGEVSAKNDPEPGTVYAGPLVVLTSRFSASASEITAGALQDYGRALIVGDPATHGKGTVQRVLDIGDYLEAKGAPPKLGALKLTIEQFYRPNGESTQARGVVSDVTIPSLIEAIAIPEKDEEYALPFDKVKAVPHAQLNLVPEDLKTKLREQSAKRVRESAEFARLLKDVERLKERKARKKLPLNEDELKEQLKKDDSEKLDKRTEEATPKDNSGNPEYKFKRTYLNNEVLQIMEDFVTAKK
jgi:carboxyl-terminal processing protease